MNQNLSQQVSRLRISRRKVVALPAEGTQLILKMNVPPERQRIVGENRSRIENMIQREREMIEGQKEAILKGETRIPGKAYFMDSLGNLREI
jgi:hypothetical protein